MIPVKLLLIGLGAGIVVLVAVIALVIVLILKNNKKKEIPRTYGESPLMNSVNSVAVGNPGVTENVFGTQGEAGQTIKPTHVDDIGHYTIPTSDKSSIHIGKIHAVGRRKNQQDSFAYSDVQDLAQIEKKGVLLLVFLLG